MHTDAAQSIGKIPSDVNVLGVDLLSIAGHKIYAPKGIGALFVRRGCQIAKFIHGAGHENGRRAGTENVLGIVGLGKACEIARRDLEKNMLHMREMRDLLHRELTGKLDDIKLNGHPDKCLPNTLSLSFKGIEINLLLSEIKEYVAVSAGAACHSGGFNISHVLRAMKVPDEWAKATLRFSVGKMTTKDEIEKVINIFINAITIIKTRQLKELKEIKQ
jgi:cysteine desulfurase